MTRRSAHAWLVLASAAAAAAAVAAGLPTPVRAALVFWFVGVGPGLAWVNLLRLKDELACWVLGVALSLVGATLLSEAFVLLKWWSPPAILAILVIASVPPCVIAFRPERRAADLAGAS